MQEVNMDRVPYRRVTPPRTTGATVGSARQGQRQQPTGPTPRDTIFAQFIVSLLILMLVLTIAMVDIAPMVTVRDRVGQLLEGANTPEEFTGALRNFGEVWLNFTPQYHLEYNPTDITIPPELAHPLTLVEPPVTIPGLWD